MPPCNCHPPFPRPEPFSPLPRPGKTPDWGKWIRDRLAEKGALLAFPSASAFPDPGAQPNVYEALDTGILYRWDGAHYQVLVDPSAANDVLEYEDRGRFPETGERGKLYIAANTGSLYRWGGGDYVALLPGKADKAVPQAAGNLAALTQDGNLVDSGKKPADFVGKAALFDNPDTNPTVKSSLLPSYVDDVVEYASLSAFPQPGEAGKIYVALDTNIQYRWSGTQYTEIAKVIIPSTSAPLVDGTASTGSSEAYSRGDHRHPTDTSRMAASATGADIAVSGTDATKISAALAGKASKADATLTERSGFSEWNVVCSDPTIHGFVVYDGDGRKYKLYDSEYEDILFDETEAVWPEDTATSLQFRYVDADFTFVATREALQGYVLGSQTDKPLASEAEAEALRNGKQDALSAQQLANIAAVPNKLDKSGGTFGATTISLTDGGIAVSDTQSSNLTLLSSSYNFLVHRDGLGVRYFAAPSTSGTLALAAANPTAGNLAALDANGNPTDSGKKPSDFATAAQGAKADAALSRAEAEAGFTEWNLEDGAIPTALQLTGQPHIVAEDGGTYWKVPLIGIGDVRIDDTPADTNATSLSWQGRIEGLEISFTATRTRLPTMADVNAKLDAASAAPAFSSDSSVSYAVGSHVTYNGMLYVCTTATTGGAWDASKWTADTMTDPDAVLDITSQNQLRVMAKDGSTLLWAQGYNLASTSSATLACDACNNFTFADGATTQAFALPTAPTGKVGDFGLDIDNSANTGAATLTLTGLDTIFSVVVPKGESLNDMLAIAAGELAQFYVTLTTFRVNNLPTWHIVKQVVENGGAQS